jgi:hypothetical protein
LLDALQCALDLSSNREVYAVEVNALDADAVALYVRYGFTPLLHNPKHLYLTMATPQKARGPNQKC